MSPNIPLATLATKLWFLRVCGVEYKKVDFEVGLNVFRTVAYAWEADDDKVAVHMIYGGRPLLPLECRPPLLITNDDQVKELVRMMARLLYDEEKSADGE